MEYYIPLSSGIWISSVVMWCVRCCRTTDENDNDKNENDKNENGKNENGKNENDNNV